MTDPQQGADDGRSEHPDARGESLTRTTVDSSSTCSEELGQLLESVALGNGDAFASLYALTAPRVYGLALKVLRNPVHAEEVAQEVYLEVWCKSTRFEADRGTGLAWIMRLVHGRAVDRVRAERTRQGREEVYHRKETPIPPAMCDPVHDVVSESIEARRVRYALTNLSPLRREAVELAFLGGYTYPEVAVLLHVPKSTAKTRIRSGLHELRDLLETAP